MAHGFPESLRTSVGLEKFPQKGEGKMLEVSLGTLLLIYGVLFLAGMIATVALLAGAVGN